MGLFLQALNKGKVISIIIDGEFFKEIRKIDNKIICSEFSATDHYPDEIREKELFTEFDVVSEISNYDWNLLGENYYD